MWLALLVPMGLLAAGPQTPQVVIDEVVAIVDGEVITQSEVLIDARIRLVLGRGALGIMALAKLDSGILDASLENLVNQVLINQRLRRLGAQPLPDRVIDLALTRFISHFKSEDAFEAYKRRYGIPLDAISSTLRRELENSRYLQERLGLGGRSGSIDQGAENQGEVVRRWMEQLRKGVEIRLLQSNGELEIQ